MAKDIKNATFMLHKEFIEELEIQIEKLRNQEEYRMLRLSKSTALEILCKRGFK